MKSDLSAKIAYLGRLSEPAWQDLEAEYLKRLPRVQSLTRFDVKSVAYKGVLNDLKTLSTFKQLHQNNSFVIALDGSGLVVTSEQIAKKWQNLCLSGRSPLFVVGPSDGFNPEQKASADELWSFGQLTLPNSLAYILLLEQLYRATTILNGSPYHKYSCSMSQKR